MNRSAESWGSQLLDLCSSAERELVLVAPFVKVQTLRRLLSGVSASVSITCVTRWRAEEVAAGVSDLEVFEELGLRERATLRLLLPLHAKYFRADARCLVGSANLTGQALGWSGQSNVELLLEESFAHPLLQQFEDFVTASSHEATDDIRALVAAASEQLQARFAPTAGSSELLEPTSAPTRIDLRSWLPSLRQPEDLYLAYVNQEVQLTTMSRAAATADLVALDIAPGLPRPLFEATVGIALIQMPMIARIDHLLAAPQRFGAVRDFIWSDIETSKGEATFMWQTTMRWLMHFLPGRYLRRVPSHSEVFVRANS